MNDLRHNAIVGRLFGGSACVACCAVPMLIVTGVASAATMATIGFSIAAALVITTSTVIVLSGRTPPASAWQRRWIAGGGVALGASAGIAGFEHTILVVAAVTLLSVSALLAVGDRQDNLLHTPT